MKFRLIIPFLFLYGLGNAQTTANQQHNLSKKVSFNVRQERVSDVLTKMSKAGDFYFAYNGHLIQQDSLVDLQVRNAPVRDVLDQMFHGKVDYKENSEYIILRYAVNHLTIEPENITTAENLYLISGHVIDTQTGRRVKQASVYEKRFLQSTLTDNDGYFRMRFKGDHKEVILTASKETYRDTALVFLSDITIKPEGYNDPDKEKGTMFSNAIEELGIGRFFISSKQRIQNLNIPSFFANTPFQTSLTPGLSSHGMMSSKVINKASFNVLGGYTAGVDGVEVAGLFNLNKGDARQLQVAGLFNGVGGSVSGIQVAGLYNDVRGSLKGVEVTGLLNHVKSDVGGAQVAGLANVASQKMKGMQVAGLVNIVSDQLQGMQISGLGNVAKGDRTGLQLAGLGNISYRNSSGVQFAGIGNIASGNSSGIQIGALFNYAKNNTGVQIGLVNISGSSNGTSIGLINFTKNGYHKISLSANELVNANIALKTGNANLYSIIFAGKNFSDTAKVETFGLGFGHDFIFGKTLSLAPELSFQYLYLGNWKYANILTKIQTNLQVKVFNGFSIFGGPSYSYYNSDNPGRSGVKNYKQQIAPKNHHHFSGNNKGWFGWNIGITIM